MGMLVQFTLKNVLSFKEETTIDMTAVHAYKEHESNLIDIGRKERLLKVAAIYGANASGKSNLRFAMGIFQSIVMESMNNVADDEEMAIRKYYFPFLFEKEYEDSEFEIIMIIENFEYRYGFEYNAKCIVAEWLYRKNLETNRMITIFERTAKTVDFGASVRRECEMYKNQIPEETLVLTMLNKFKLGTDVFHVIYTGIFDTLVLPPDFGEDRTFLKKYLPAIIENDKDQFIDFLTATDTGMKDILCVDNEDDVRFPTVHVGKDGEQYFLDLFSESEGTIKSIMFYIYARVAISGNKVIFVDELNIKLHPLLLKFIIDLFYESDSLSQLIYTTHDTTLMDKKFFRRDQIWFVQKDQFGYSGLSALSDFKVRSDASFEKDYLAGVYGGIPYLKEFSIKEGE